MKNVFLFILRLDFSLVLAGVFIFNVLRNKNREVLYYDKSANNIREKNLFYKNDEVFLIHSKCMLVFSAVRKYLKY